MTKSWTLEDGQRCITEFLDIAVGVECPDELADIVEDALGGLPPVFSEVEARALFDYAVELALDVSDDVDSLGRSVSFESLIAPADEPRDDTPPEPGAESTEAGARIFASDDFVRVVESPITIGGAASWAWIFTRNVAGETTGGVYVSHSSARVLIQGLRKFVEAAEKASEGLKKFSEAVDDSSLGEEREKP